MEDDDHDRWSDEYRALDDDLEPFVCRVHENWDDIVGWLRPPTPEEELISDLWYFFNAALCNNSEVFTYVDFMTEHRSQLEAIGAHGCLDALQVLTPLYLEMKTLPDEEHADYWTRKRLEIEAGEALREDILSFGRLLLRYAKEHSARIG